MEVNIPETDLKGFNQQAKQKLSEATTEFISDMIEESNRLESSRNTTGDEPEITSSMVYDAQVLIRRGVAQPRKGMGVKVLRVVAAVSSLAVGLLYDSTKLQSPEYMLLFVCAITAAILTVTISTIKEQ